MRLTGLSYKTANWELEDIEFEDVSLIVGKNATGKSRTLAVLHLLHEIITQKRAITQAAKWSARFYNGMEAVVYEFETAMQNNAHVVVEKMTVNDETVFERDKEHVRIKNLLSKQFEDGNPPTDKLVIHVLRDLKKYAYIEDIVKWAEQSFGFRFSHFSPNYTNEVERYILLSKSDHLFKLFDEFEEVTRKIIVKELTDIGFDVESLKVLSNNGDYLIALREKNIANSIFQHSISQGMFRSLAILIFIEYLISKKSTATIIIDDLCEGLDYERATKLGRLLFEKCLAKKIQLIATSNDMFLMDVVDLKYWNVLQRTGQVVTAINAKNHPGLFEDFKFTGLSNFDFFASDYIAQNL